MMMLVATLARVLAYRTLGCVDSSRTYWRIFRALLTPSPGHSQSR
jgi:hypothetical protein